MSSGELTDVGRITSSMRKVVINTLAEGVSPVKSSLQAPYRCSGK